MRAPLLAAGALALLAMPAPLAAQQARVDRSKTAKALARLPRAQGERPVVAIYDVRSAVAECRPRPRSRCS